jgi:hypothetical protein
MVLIKTPDLPPRFAKFMVPLEMNKMDVRDFLFHGYNVRALSVRSWVYQRPLEVIEGRGARPSFLQWHRRKAIKYMLIEMDEDFIWPKKPDSFKEYVLSNQGHSASWTLDVGHWKLTKFGVGGIRRFGRHRGRIRRNRACGYKRQMTSRMSRRIE